MSDYRVLHLLPDLAVGGGQMMVLRLSERMRQVGANATVVSYGHCSDMSDEFERAGVRVFELGLHGLRDLPTAIWRLDEIVKSQHVSVLHTHGTWVDKFPGHILAARNALPQVTTLHGMPPVYDIWNGTGRSRLRNVLQSGLFKFDWWVAPGRLHGAAAVSDAVRNAWQSWLDRMCRNGSFEERVIYWGIDPERFLEMEPADIARYRDEIAGVSQPSGPLILSVSRLEASKNVAALPLAMEVVIGRWPNAVLGIVGDGPEWQTLQNVVEARGLQSHVRLLGRRNDVPQLLAAADISVFASRVEGFGLVVLESLAAGTPVVCFDLPSLKFLRAQVDTIWAAYGMSAQALGYALCTALNDPELGGRGSAARNIVLNSWTLDQTVVAYDNLYRAVLSAYRA